MIGIVDTGVLLLCYTELHKNIYFKIIYRAITLAGTLKRGTELWRERGKREGEEGGREKGRPRRLLELLYIKKVIIVVIATCHREINYEHMANFVSSLIKINSCSYIIHRHSAI